MMVGNNETWYGFMDEGFNQYLNMLSRADVQGQPPRLNGVGQGYDRISGDERQAPMMWDANYGGPLYDFQAYSNTPTPGRSGARRLGTTPSSCALP